MSFKIFVFILPLHVLLYFTFFSEKKLYLCVKLYRKLSCKIVLVGCNIFSFQRKKNQKNLFFLQIIDIYMYMWYTSDKIKIFNMKSFYLTPSKQIFGGEGNNRNYLVCLSLRQSLKSCPVQIFLIEKKIAYDVDVSYNFYSRSQVQGHWKEKCLFLVQSISFSLRNI